MKILAVFIFGLYTLALIGVTLYCLLQFHLLMHYRKSRKKENIITPLSLQSGSLPFVTIQLPVYNECYVVERLIDNIVRIDYPRDKFEIQILDDSTDGTSEICREKTIFYSEQGFTIHHLQRNERHGFKAGALQQGLSSARGEFIAIFDADFLPAPDFLLQTIAHFTDPSVGVVQTRWDHINEAYSLITRLQAFQLNVHFTIEQSGRQRAGYLLQFNGTAGVWRREAITDAGGWRSDTLTEDLDLSYRAQLKGWKIKYMQDVIAPAELPSEMSGLKSQQFRWMKGGAENAKRLIPLIIQSKLPLTQKLHAINHLLSSSVFLFVFVLGVVSVPVLFFAESLQINIHIYAVFMVGLLTTCTVYFVGNTVASKDDNSLLQRVLNFCMMFP
ncbi:MAG TPA: cellulose synthase family protein, partial [Saprospiraceae bacterium]|nr:cellulose synthase family protein [Saprospiraceae bacterium]